MQRGLGENLINVFAGEMCIYRIRATGALRKVISNRDTFRELMQWSEEHGKQKQTQCE